MRNSKKIEKLLVIRLSAMGDVAMTVPVLSALARQHPQVRITVLTKPFFKPLFAQLENVEVFDAEVQGRHKGIFGLWKLYRELRALHIDAVADLHNVLRSKILGLYFRTGGISVEQIDKGRAEKRALTASKDKVFEPLKTTHQRYADVFMKLGFSVDLSKARPLAKQTVSDNIFSFFDFGVAHSSATSNRTQKWLGIAPFAAFEGKMYPLHSMEDVVQQLNDTENYKIFLFGGGEEEQKKLQGLATRFEHCVNMVGKLSFPEELALISNLDAILSMDSGNGHLAAMYRIPVITLWGVTHPYAGFCPFGQDSANHLLVDREKFPLVPTSVYGNKMPEGYEKVMATIPPEAVVAKVTAVMNEG